MPQFRSRPTKRAQQLRNNATDAERRLWRHLRARQLEGFKFSRQMPVGPFICDFMCRERQLIVEYRSWMDSVAVAMTPDNHALAVRIAELPDIVRGYEDVKLANVVRYRKQGEQLISELVMQAPQLHGEAHLSRG